jgi:hypothetical protein
MKPRSTYNVIVLNLVSLTPGTHDKGIVHRDDSDDLNTLLLQLRQLLDVFGQVVNGACGGEGTYDDIS